MSNTLKNLVLTAFALFSFNAFAAPINVNTADVQTLSANGTFSTAMDLTAVKGIGEKTVLKNQANIAISANELAVKIAQQNSE